MYQQWEKGDIMIRRRWADGVMEEPKSLASKAPVEMTEQLAKILRLWRRESNYVTEDDLIFAIEVMKGEQPRTSCTISQKIVRPAAGGWASSTRTARASACTISGTRWRRFSLSKEQSRRSFSASSDTRPCR